MESLKQQAQELVNQGAALHLNGHLSAAMEKYEAAIKIDDQNATAHNNLGYVLAQEGKYDSAIELYNRSIALKVDNTTAFMNLGNAYICKGDLDRGARYLKKIH